MASQGSMRREGGGFWRTTGAALAMALLACFLSALPARWRDVMDLVSPPRMPSALPTDTPGRARIARELAASPAPEARETLWRLSFDANHFVRGAALEALALAQEGGRTDPRKAHRLRQIAADDTDWNRRSASVLLIQLDPVAALPLVEPLYLKTTNPNTRAALRAALKEKDGAALRTALVRAKSAILLDLLRAP